MQVLINKINGIVEGVNISPTPFNYIVKVNDDFKLAKTVEVQEGEKQKENEQGQPLYLKEVYRTEVKQVVVGKDEVLENTGFPIMITTQKTNEAGEKLYLEKLYDELGEAIDQAEVTEPIDEDGTPNEPIMVTSQKTSVGGKPLFYKDVIEDVEEEVLDHVEEVTEGETPIMIPNLVTKVYDITSDPSQFSVEEVIIAKYQGLLDNSQKDFIIADLFLNEDDIDLSDPNHSANTGVALLELLPKGQAKTKSISLEEPSTEFEILEFDAPEGIEIYLAGNKFVDGKLSLANPVSNCTIKFVNTTDRPKQVKSYAIGY